MQQGLVKSAEKVVCLVTGGGFKHLESIDAMLEGASMPLVNIDEI